MHNCSNASDIASSWLFTPLLSLLLLHLYLYFWAVWLAATSSEQANQLARESSRSEQPKESREQQQQQEEVGRGRGWGKAASARRASVCGFCLLLKFTILMHCHLTVDSATRRVRRRECGCVCLTASVCVCVRVRVCVPGY